MNFIWRYWFGRPDVLVMPVESHFRYSPITLQDAFCTRIGSLEGGYVSVARESALSVYLV